MMFVVFLEKAECCSRKRHCFRGDGMGEVGGNKWKKELGKLISLSAWRSFSIRGCPLVLMETGF